MPLTLSGTTGITYPDGNAVTPSLTGQDADTGVFFGTNTLGLSTGGTERLTVNSSGNIGIGNVSPASALHILKTNSTTWLSTWGGVSDYLPFDHELTIESLPENVENSFASLFFCAGVAGGAGRNTARIAAIRRGSFVTDLAFSTRGPASNQIEKLRITAAGNVGIGITNPSSKLHISDYYTTPTGGLDAGIKQVISAQFYAGLNILSGNASYIHFGDYSNADVGGIIYDHDNDFLRIDINAGERLRITSSGNVGIGTTNPSEKFHVDGNVFVTNYGSGNRYIRFDADNSYNSFDLRGVYPGAGNATKSFIRSIPTGGYANQNVIIGTTNASSFTGSALEVVRVTAGGSLVRNVYPSHSFVSPTEIRLDDFLAGSYLYAHGGHFFMQPFIRGESDITVDLLTFSGDSTNCGTIIYLEFLVSSATVANVGVFDGFAYRQRSGGNPFTNTGTSITTRYGTTTPGTLSWSGNTLRFTTTSPAYTKYTVRAFVSSHDSASVTAAR